MAISNEYILNRIAAVETRINELQKILENIPKLRQVGALKAVFEQENKEINAKLVDIISRLEKLEKK